MEKDFLRTLFIFSGPQAEEGGHTQHDADDAVDREEGLVQAGQVPGGDQAMLHQQQPGRQ